MKWTNKRFEIGSLLRQISLFVLLSVFVFQLLSPSATAAASLVDGDAHHQAISDVASDCPMHLAKMASTADTVQENGVSQEKCPDCVLSTCCFHVTFATPQLIAVAVLLPGAKLLDLGIRNGFGAYYAQERPPRHV